MVEIMAYFGVCLLGFLALIVIFGGTFCSARYITSAFKYKTLVPLEINTMVYAFGAAFTILFLVTALMSFFAWSVGMVFGV